MTISASPLPATAARILIVEDEGLIAEDLSDILSANGYAVAGIAESSLSALAQVQDLKPDLILMDIRLKGEMDGIETTARLRGRFDIPVVYLTSHTDIQTLDRAKMTGAFGFLSKPINTRNLIITIEMALQKHQADRAIRHQRSWMATALGTMADAMVIINCDRKIQFVNGPAEVLTGWTDEQCRGKDITAILPLRDTISGTNQDQVFSMPSKNGPPRRLPRHLLASKRSGEAFAIDGSVSTSVDEGVVVGAVITFHNATARNAQDDEIRHSDKMQAVGHLAAGISHDFNNLLFVILGHAEEMLHSPTTSEDGRRHLDQVKKAGEHAVTITQQLLSFSRKQPVEKQDVDLNEMIRTTEELLRRVGGPCSVELKLDEEAGAVWGDPGQLKQVLMNLVANARDSTLGTGVIKIETSSVVIPDADFNPETGAVFVALSVTDMGKGMSAETADHLFEPFFTTKTLGSGTGLGLSIVHSIVTDHGGTVDVDSVLGSGSIFTVYLPSAQVSTGTQVTGNLGDSEVAVPATILVVDDQEDVRRLICGFLARAGYGVLEAAGGQEAIRISAEHAGTIDLLISDVMMPISSGFDVARALAERRTETKIILISGYAQDLVDGEEKLPAGARFLSKPFTRNELLQTVNALLPANAVIHRPGLLPGALRTERQPTPGGPFPSQTPYN